MASCGDAMVEPCAITCLAAESSNAALSTHKRPVLLAASDSTGRSIPCTQARAPRQPTCFPASNGHGPIAPNCWQGDSVAEVGRAQPAHHQLTRIHLDVA